MKKMTANEIRTTWLKFFQSKGHHIEPGSSLIPKNDPTLLWINAGVAALKKYFDGSEIPPSRRITNAQKSIRTNDIENVGKTDRHHTFFEMMGNFSIGDYFRKEAIAYAYELLFSDKYFGFDKNNLYMTYHTDDLETKKCWIENGVEESHLIPLDGNFWEIGEGPCGPDTEMFYDRGEKYDPKHLGIKMLKEDIENDRYIEIWNIVFSQYNAVSGVERKNYKELPSKNIDTGAGLERFACIMQETESNFETDLFWPIIEKTMQMSGKKYENNKMAFRVIADHIRACTFALADGEMFSNEGRGYVLRRLIRRAERYGRVLGIEKPFLYELVDTVVSIMKDYYPYLLEKRDQTIKMIKSEEEKFLKTLVNGEVVLKKMIKDSKSLSKEDMFKLYDTYGFPKELTMEICDENNVSYDLDGFNSLMEEQKQRARSARGDLQSMNKQSFDLMNFTEKSEFSYDDLVLDAKIIGLFVDGKKVDSINGSGEVIFDKTCFYAESGGQVADTGLISNKDVEAKVNNVTKAPNKQFLHSVEVLYGELKIGDKLTLKVDRNRRNKITRNHSSVHLLQRALNDVLGDSIAQHGSFVCEEYSHFDFNYGSKMSEEQLNEVERKVNEWISEEIEEKTLILPIEEAKKLGAKALFDEKYGDVVRVVTFGDVSKEFCGGTHVKNSNGIGLFVIEYEESVASGIRRIQSRTSINAFELMKKRENVLNRVKNTLSANSYSEVENRLNTLNNEKMFLKKENESLNSKLANNSANNLKSLFAKNSNNIDVLVEFIKDSKRDNLLSMIDKLKADFKNSVILLIGDDGQTLPIVCSVNGDALKMYQAGAVVRNIAPILNGSGGGRPDLASGAGKDKQSINKAIKAAKELLNNA
ncbi:MAG: alanine--tRNA ligase [Bacilli bacterium]|nr:alanine--tRNA ligase [Bacilli bacterium]